MLHTWSIWDLYLLKINIYIYREREASIKLIITNSKWSSKKLKQRSVTKHSAGCSKLGFPQGAGAVAILGGLFQWESLIIKTSPKRKLKKQANTQPTDFRARNLGDISACK